MNYLLVMPKEAAKSSGGYNFFPVGIAYISAALKQKKFKVVTSNLEYYPDSTYNALKELITSHNVDVIGIPGLSPDFYSVKEIIDYSKQIKPSILTVVGGGIISGDPEPAMKALNADIGVIGQGEETMCDLAEVLDNGKSYSNIRGLIFKNQKGELTRTLARPDIDDIDSIPLPDYLGFSYLDYMKKTDYAAVTVVASRSCPYQCTFCFHPSGKKYRQRSLDSIFAEIDYLKSISPFKQLILSDEVFAMRKERLVEFCERIKPYNVPWSLQLRVTDIDEETVKMMKDAGCNCISFGLESADNNILKSMRKKITIEQIETALKITYDNNIDIQGGFIFGDKAETKETAARTLEWHNRHPHYGIELNMIRAFPGTSLYEYACEQGKIDRNQFLYERCPHVNISRMSNEEYRNLASSIYVTNMRPKYQPKQISVNNIDETGLCSVDVKCDKCGTAFSYSTDILHWRRWNCTGCYQRYYIDPFKDIEHSQELMNSYFRHGKTVALWGGGEICIKMLDNYPLLGEDRFKVVDISKSRQGYTICGKKIFPPDIIRDENITKVVATVVQRKEQIFNQIQRDFPFVKEVYLPGIQISDGKCLLDLKLIDLCQIR